MKQKPSKRRDVAQQQTPPEPVRETHHDGVARLQAASTFHSGPLPPAEHLQKYDDVLPGLAERIVTMAEIEGEHRRKTERKSGWRDFFVTIFGQILAFGVTLVLAGLAVFLIMNDKDAAGFISMVAAVVPTITAVFLNRKKNATESQ